MTVKQILSDYETGLITRAEAVGALAGLISPDSLDVVLSELSPELLEALRQWAFQTDSDVVVTLGANLSRSEAIGIADHVRSAIPAIRTRLGTGDNLPAPDGATHRVRGGCEIVVTRRPVESSFFRQSLNRLRELRGNYPEWPWLVCLALEEMFRQRLHVDFPYAGEIFIDRDKHAAGKTGDREKPMVYSLYHRCHSQSNGCLQIGTDTYWILGYEFPTQGGSKEKMCKADLVGLRSDGGLVVFECKRRDNKYPPFSALLEGLDYLSALMGKTNHQKLVSGFGKWKEKLRAENRIPSGFENAMPSLLAKPSVVLLAPQQYYDFYSRRKKGARNKRGEGWKEMARVAPKAFSSLEVCFAICDFRTCAASWFDVANG